MAVTILRYTLHVSWRTIIWDLIPLPLSIICITFVQFDLLDQYLKNQFDFQSVSCRKERDRRHERQSKKNERRKRCEFIMLIGLIVDRLKDKDVALFLESWLLTSFNLCVIRPSSQLHKLQSSKVDLIL